MTPIPVTLITGFLGSGKTSLLNTLLRDPAFAQTAGHLFHGLEMRVERRVAVDDVEERHDARKRKLPINRSIDEAEAGRKQRIDDRRRIGKPCRRREGSRPHRAATGAPGRPADCHAS